MIEILGIIPARGGSKGVPGKNLALVAGRPLIAWTTRAAQASGCISRLIVSTDDQVIADVARQHGAEVPFLRPAELAQDDTPGIEPVLHAVRWLDEYEDYQPGYIMLLQPTSPFRSGEDIVAVVKLAQSRQADAVVSVCPAHHHPYWMKRLDAEGRMCDFIKLNQSYASRQDLPDVYALNGAIYLVRREVLLTQRKFYTDATFGYVMPVERSLDVDSPWDLHLANLAMSDQVSLDSR
jgi:CMP-N,N'-diacetyllegionaminic acid synthase